MKNIIYFFIATSFLILVLHVPVAADQHQVLLLYNDNLDRSTVETALGNVGITATAISIDSVTVSDIDDQDLIILASSDDFSTDDPIENALLSYIQDQSHHLLVISPYVEEFSGDLETALGIDGIDEITEDTAQQWTVTFDQDYANFSVGEEVDYTGVTSMISLDSSANLIASFTSATGENEEDLELPRPALWNVSAPGSVLVTPMRVYENSGGLGLDQVPIPFATFIQDLVKNMYLQASNAGTPGTGVTTRGDNQPPGTQSNNLDNLQLTTPQLGLVAALLALILLIVAKILGIGRWLIDKGYGLLIFVVGAFYNISDRTLSHSEVVMNMTRNEILAYLNHVGAYGAHLREIKTITGQGSGSLLWHLQMLEDYQFINKYSVSSYTVFVAEDFHFDPKLKQIELEMQSKYTLTLLDILTHHPGADVTLTQLQEETGISRRAIRRLVKKLQDHGIVAVEKYPEMSIEILDSATLRHLFLSFELRETFDREIETPEIERL